MSEPSSWPLSNEAIRVRVPNYLMAALQHDSLSIDCFPTAIGFYPYAQKHKMKRSDHDDFIVIYCASGSGFLQMDQYQGKVERGDIFIIPPNAPHHYAADDASPWTLFWCHFRGEQALRFYQHINIDPLQPIIHSSNDMNLLANFTSLVDIAKSSFSLAGYIHAANQLKQILTLIERIKNSKQKDKTGIILPDIQQFMRSNLHKHLSLDELASLSYLSKYHFSRKYRELTGMPPLEYFLNMKMEHACFLLEHELISISEVAFALGYEDPLYFSRVFRKVNGMSPSRYRKKYALKKLD